MRKRWRWIVGGIVVLALAIGLWWAINRRLPYKFMEGGHEQSVWIRTGFGPDTTVRSYLVPKSFPDIVELAAAELQAKRWHQVDMGSKTLDVCFSRGVTVDEWLQDSVYIRHPSSSEQGVVVDIATPTNASDRVRIWIDRKIEQLGPPSPRSSAPDP